MTDIVSDFITNFRKSIWKKVKERQKREKPGHFEYGLYVASLTGGYRGKTGIICPRIFVSHPCSQKQPRYPLASLQIDLKTAHYWAEML